MKIKNKITLLFTLLVTAILLVLNISIYYLTSVERAEMFKNRLRNRAGNNAQIFDYFGDSSISMLRRIDAGSLAALNDKAVSIVDTNGNYFYHYESENTERLIVDESTLRDVRKSGQVSFEMGKREGIAIQYEGANRNFIVAVMALDVDGRLSLLQLRKILIVSLLIGMLVTLVIGFLFSSQLVKPIKAIIREVKEISSHNLSRRLPATSSADELNDLSKTFNNLLNRLEDSFDSQRKFISNASHELSTPLTSISSQLQITLQKERTAAEYQQVLQSIQEDAVQMGQLTKSLLEIAKTGGQGGIELNDLRVDELLLKVIADIKRINQQYQVDLQFLNFPENERQCMVFGNFDLLYSAIKNIIENGCKYSPDKKSSVKLSFASGNVLIEVLNQGDIITEDEIQQVFQPFFRGNSATDHQGFGLGLPLAKRIIGLHKGQITIKSDASGTCFSISIPALPSDQF